MSHFIKQHFLVAFLFLYICEQFLTYLNITLLFFCRLHLHTYVYSAIFITAGFCHYGQIWCANRYNDCCICIHIYTTLIVTCYLLRHI